jgi:hypothetical protein
VRTLISVIVVSLAVSISLVSATRSAPFQLTGVIASGGGSGSTYRIVLRGSNGSTTGTGTSKIGPEPVFVPSLVTHTASSLAVSCVTYHAVITSSQSVYQAELAWAQAAWARLSVYPRCDANPVGTLNLLRIWTQIVEDRLPSPHIQVNPSFGLVNIPLELITSSTTSTALTVTTNDGKLSIAAHGWLSWGFSSSEPRTAPPAGPDKSTWYRPTHPGVIRAVLVEHWQGTYSVAGISGSLPLLAQTSAPVSIPVISLTSELHNVT